MSKLKKFAAGLSVVIILVVGGGAGSYWYMNRIPPQLVEPNYFTTYKTQDTTHVSQVATAK